MIGSVVIIFGVGLVMSLFLCILSVLFFIFGYIGMVFFVIDKYYLIYSYVGLDCMFY